ncbi:hypothetical protein [Stenotrophomonas sp.]|uniref:hypothetical protein n=1 Tax=Stenotrophomonas sp. TaxID=69392 RepID=UPI0029C01063|nr:hypothetical protein [Stenotrophomonas sp.]
MKFALKEGRPVVGIGAVEAAWIHPSPQSGSDVGCVQVLLTPRPTKADTGRRKRARP